MFQYMTRILRLPRVIAFASLFWPIIVMAADPTTSTSVLSTPPNSPVTPGNVAGPVSLMSNREFWLSCIILIFGLAIILVEFFLFRQVVEKRTDEIAKIYTVTLIIIGTLVLISSGFTNEQIAPALGLFGTIAGYLLGRSESRASQTKDHSVTGGEK